MKLLVLLQLLILLTLANGAPVVAKKLLGTRFAAPLDGGLRCPDGRPVFGASKTIRGALASLLATAIGAAVIGLTPQLGALVAGAAMAGDLFSSFIKRRLGLRPSARAIGLDQVPESLLPMLACRETFSLTAADIALMVAVFFVGEIVLSRFLYRLHLRDEPY